MAVASEQAASLRIATGAAKVANVALAFSLISARQCVTLGTRVDGCEAGMQAMLDRLAGVLSRTTVVEAAVAAQKRAHDRLRSSLEAIQSAVESLDARMGRLERSATVRDAVIDAIAAVIAWRLAGAALGVARALGGNHLVPRHNSIVSIVSQCESMRLGQPSLNCRQ